MVDPQLLEILCCPDIRLPLRMASRSELDAVNAVIRTGTQRNKAGQPVRDELQEGLMRQDGILIYPVRDGIPILLIDEGLSTGVR